MEAADVIGLLRVIPVFFVLVFEVVVVLFGVFVFEVEILVLAFVLQFGRKQVEVFGTVDDGLVPQAFEAVLVAVERSPEEVFQGGDAQPGDR